MQGSRCKLVINSRHWLRHLSHEQTIRSEGGRYTCPNCLVPYRRPWAARTNSASTNAPTLVPAQGHCQTHTPTLVSTSKHPRVLGSSTSWRERKPRRTSFKQAIAGIYDSTNEDNIDPSNRPRRYRIPGSRLRLRPTVPRESGATRAT